MQADPRPPTDFYKPFRLLKIHSDVTTELVLFAAGAFSGWGGQVPLTRWGNDRIAP